MTRSAEDLYNSILVSIGAESVVLGSLTTHTSCLGGFCGPGGSQLAGSWSLVFREAGDIAISWGFVSMIGKRERPA